MKINIKQYEYEKKEVASKEIMLPDKTSYYFETGIRRSIKIIPHFTTRNREQHNKDEELYELEIICLYNSFQCKAEKFKIRISDIETIYYSENHEHKRFITALVEGWLQKRTKEQFEADFNYTFSELHTLSS
jgi:hypothetical protein